MPPPVLEFRHVSKKKRKDETQAIIKKRCSELLKMQNDEGWDCFYENPDGVAGGEAFTLRSQRSKTFSLSR